MTRPAPQELDRVIGARLRKARKINWLTQQELAEHIGVKFQQLQKYESGENRISASRLYRASLVLDRPMEYFCNEQSEAVETAANIKKFGSIIDAIGDEEFRNRLLDLARHHNEIVDQSGHIKSNE